MTLSNWIELAVIAIILAAGLSLLLYFRHKFRNLDGFEGVITEENQTPRRVEPDWAEELKQLEKSAKKKAR